MSVRHAVLRAFLVLGLSVVSAPVVHAHAVLVSASPQENALLQRAPANVTLVFNEPVRPLAVQMYSPDGRRIDYSDQIAPGTELEAQFPATSVEGTYVLSWRVVSEDGHPIRGSQVFSVGKVTDIADGASQLGDPAVPVAIWVAKALLYICLIAGVGGAFFGAYIASLPRMVYRYTFVLLSLGLVLAVASIGLQGLDALGRSFAALAGPSVWSTALGTSYGATLLMLLLAMLLACTSLTYAGVVGRAVAAAALCVLGWALASSGHAGSADPKWLTRPAIFVHAVAITFWLGALWPLLGYLATGDDQGRAAVRRFSRCIPWFVGLLLASGAILFAVQMGWPNRQWLAPYGLILLAKLVLLGGLFALALYNRSRLTAPVLQGAKGQIDRMRLSIRGEIFLVVAVVMLVSGWRFTPPPRVLHELYPDPAIAELHSGDLKAGVVVDPGRPGQVAVDVTLDRSGAGVDAESVMVAFSQPELGIEPFSRLAARHGEGHWRIEGMTLPAHGVWNVSVEARIGRFEQSRLEGSLVLEKPAGADGRQPVVEAALGPLQIADPFTRATLPQAAVGGGYMVIINTGDTDDRIVSAASTIAGHVSTHGMRVENEIMRMRELQEGIPVPAGEAVRLEPGGLHLMLEQLRQPIAEGSTVPLTLTFEHAGTITIDLQALGISAGSVEDHDRHGG
jgi:copper transport protein